MSLKLDYAIAFEVTTGSYDGAKIYERIGLFILSKLKDTYGNNSGLYRSLLRSRYSGRQQMLLPN